jgi:4-hydroxy-3-methylbut-2-enyl diphosphate reductase
MDWLAAHGFSDVEHVSHVDERLTFALPQELRRALKTP